MASSWARRGPRQPTSGSRAKTATSTLGKNCFSAATIGRGLALRSFSLSIQSFRLYCARRRRIVVYSTALERRHTERYREFESHRLRFCSRFTLPSCPASDNAGCAWRAARARLASGVYRQCVLNYFCYGQFYKRSGVGLGDRGDRVRGARGGCLGVVRLHGLVVAQYTQHGYANERHEQLARRHAFRWSGHFVLMIRRLPRTAGTQARSRV